MSASNPTMREKVQSIIDNEGYNFPSHCVEELLLNADLHDANHKEYRYMIVERDSGAHEHYGTLYHSIGNVHEAVNDAVTDPECAWMPMNVYDMREAYPWPEHIYITVTSWWPALGHPDPDRED